MLVLEYKNHEAALALALGAIPAQGGIIIIIIIIIMIILSLWSYHYYDYIIIIIISSSSSSCCSSSSILPTSRPESQAGRSTRPGRMAYY